MAAFPQPHHRNDFEVAIFCALGVESDAVEALFDEFWEDASYGKAVGDINTYTLGRIGSHNVVLAHMPGIGKASAANVASSFRSSFPAIKLGLVVGICGGVPYGADNKTEIVLGDVVISTGLVTYDFGRQFDHGFISKNTLESNLGRPNAEIRALLAKLGGRRGHLRLRENTYRHLTALFQDKGFENARYLGADEDQLFEPTYRHKHHDLTLCTICDKCVGTEDEVCAAALKSSCVELKCDENKQITRSRLIRTKEVSAKVDWSHAVAQDDTDASRPFIHFGLMASGDAVMKSGKERDRIAAEKEVIAFEMEGAGVWDAFPSVVVKGVCDYADSHKNKKWQSYAASTAAACMKAFLQEWVTSDKQSQSVLSPISLDKGTIKMEAKAFESNELSEDKILACLRSLSYSNIDDQLFQSWRNQNDLPSHNGVLWIKGKPGAGKSTLMKHTLLHCQENLGHLAIIAHFFNARGKQLEKTLIGMLRSIMYQLLETDHVLCKRFAQNFVDKERKHRTEWEWSVGELQGFLLLEVKKARIKPLLLLIDALDECNDLEVQKVVKFLEDLSISAVSAKVLVYICLSSRHYPTIDMKNRLELKLEEQKQHDKDIIKYVRDKLRVRDKEISQNILERADHVFLWVVLVVEMLNQAFDCGKIRAMKGKLQEVPSDLDGIFYILLQKDNPDTRATLLMFQWVLFAIRPLSPIELYFGVIAGTEPEELGACEPQHQSLEVIERYITNISRGLIEVRKGTVAQFIHQSVNDFLLRN